MERYQTEGIVIAVKDWGETDRLIMLFSKEKGKIGVLAYGAKRPRSQLAGGMQLFTHVEVSLQPGKIFEQVKQCTIKNSYRHITEDLIKMSYGMFMLEVVNELCPERQPENRLFANLLKALALLGERNPRLVALAWAWQVLAEVGLSPQLDYCAFCGKEAGEAGLFDSSSGGYCCLGCARQTRLLLKKETRVFLQLLSSLDWVSPPDFKVSGSSLLQAEALVLDYLVHCLDKPLKSTEFIRQVGG